MKSLLLILPLLFVLFTVHAAADPATEFRTVQEAIARETLFVQRIQNRIDAAQEALRIARIKAQSDMHEAHLYAEAATRIARFGLDLYEKSSQPFEPGSTPVTVWTAITAAAAADRLRQGMEKYRSFEEFLIRDANNEYQKEINTLKAKLTAYTTRNVAPLQKRGKELQQAMGSGSR
ncbi:MAG: hypothetical protein V4710_20475 [Verrucomicrobiota bacterium]